MNLFSPRSGQMHRYTTHVGVSNGWLSGRHIALICALCAWQLSMATALAATGGVPPKQEADLLGVFRSALHNNAGYQAARAQYRASIEAEPQALSRLLPKLSASAAYNEVDQSLDGEVLKGREIDRSESFDRYAYGVTLTQPLYHREAFIGLDKADVLVHKAKLTLQKKRGELAMKAIQAYFQFVNAYTTLKYARDKKHAIKQQLREIRTRAQAGLVSKADLKAARAQYDLAAADVISAENALKVARIQLKTLTSRRRRYNMLQTLPADAPLPPFHPNDMKYWINLALQHNFALRIQRANVQLAEFKVNSVQASRWPDVNLVASYSAYNQTGSLYSSKGLAGDNEGDSASIGIQLSVPIFNGGLIASKVDQAVATHAQQASLLQQKRTEIIAGTRTAVLNIHNDKARVKALDQAIKSAKAAVHAAKVGYDVGTSTSADVLDALNKLYRAYRDYALARTQYLLDILKLKHLAGQLDKSALASMDHYLK